MNSVKFQDTKPTYINELCFYILKRNYQRKKLRTSVDENVEKQEALALPVGMESGTATVENSMEFPKKF